MKLYLPPVLAVLAVLLVLVGPCGPCVPGGPGGPGILPINKITPFLVSKSSYS